jgi:glyoxylase-like metal-dependent hydrolase (beta-lactamase superfamily II)
MLGTDNDEREAALPREAIIIDPGNMDSELLSLIEDNDFQVRGILITHDHSHHVRGLRTLMQIYDTNVYAINPVIREHRTILVRDAETVNIGQFKVEVISIPGHSADSAVYKVGNLLFTGDTLSAGLTGNTASSYGAATLATALRSKLFSLPGDYTVLPGHGPPSSLEAERRFNLDLNSPRSRRA